MYDHNKKAGNQGDVVKHTALIAAADALINTSSGDFDYADAFAGYAFNSLQSTGEWRNGISVLWQSGCRCDNANVTFWQDLWACKPGLLGSVYPGSSIFILKRCMSKGRIFRARLWDTSPAVIAQLMETYKNQQVTIYPRPAILNDFAGRKPDLLLIDPPGLRTESKKQYPDLTELLYFFDKVTNAILWFPITAQGKGSPAPETEPSLKAKRECLSHGLSVTSVRWSNGIRTCGCRLAYCLPNAAEHALTASVDDVAALMGWDSKCVEHEIAPNQRLNPTPHSGGARK